jgi:parallel beta-helix repeat protein
MQKNIVKKGLVIAVIFLFIAVSFQPVFADDNVKKSSLLFSNGNTLYVGGSGEGNYTKIQDAIDNATDDDTVFVYDDNSPYYENVVVNKSINLIGEDRNTTVIDGSNSATVVYVYSSLVTMKGLTVQNSGKGAWDHGITVSDEMNVHISDCILTGNSGGIRFNSVFNSSITECYINNNFWCSITIYLNSNNVTIENCKIENNGDELEDQPNTCQPGCIWIEGIERGCWCSNIKINSCTIYDNVYSGIGVFGRSQNIEIYNNDIHGHTKPRYAAGIKVGYLTILGREGGVDIHDNYISENDNGIFFQDVLKFVTIKHNNISSNYKDGVYLFRSSGNKIFENNFLNNARNAYFHLRSFLNQWDGNYWNKSRTLPYPIIGSLRFSIPWINFDWHPAKEPYDIPMGG